MPDVGIALSRPYIHPQSSVLPGIYVCQAKGPFNTFLFTNDHSSSLVTFQFNFIQSDYLSVGDSPTSSSIYITDNLQDPGSLTLL